MKKKTFIIALPLVLILGWVFQLLWSAGQFKTISPYFKGTCRQVKGVVGGEDITIHPKTNIAYISACDRRSVENGGPGKGAVYAYDLNQASPEPVLLTNGPGKDFQPHGLSLYVGPEGRASLFVVNHGDGQDAVEVFDLISGKLSHRKTITGPLLLSPNDLVAVGHDRFYVTNDHGWYTPVKKALEEYLKLRLSNILYFDGNAFSKVAGGIGYANGINVSPDGKKLYVAGVTEKALHYYDRNIEKGSLTLRGTIPLESGPDNIEIDSKGGLWVAAHPQLLHFVSHSKDPEKLSPSQVLHLTFTGDDTWEIEEVFLNKGDLLSGSAVGAVSGNRLLIGPVFDPCFLDCQMQ